MVTGAPWRDNWVIKWTVLGLGLELDWDWDWDWNRDWDWGWDWDWIGTGTGTGIRAGAGTGTGTGIGAGAGATTTRRQQHLFATHPGSWLMSSSAARPRFRQRLVHITKILQDEKAFHN